MDAKGAGAKFGGAGLEGRLIPVLNSHGAAKRGAADPERPISRA